MVKWLIWYGPKLHNTALMRPLERENLGTRTLLENRIDTNTVNDMGKMSLVLAVHLGDYYMGPTLQYAMNLVKLQKTGHILADIGTWQTYLSEW